MGLEEIINSYLTEFKVEVKFSKKALEDLSSYDKKIQEKIIALILKRGKTGPLIKPKGIGEPLHKDLSGFTKIKPKHFKLRIVYRPTEVGDIIRMEIIAIGPRNKEKVYKIAAARLIYFINEMKQD